MEASTSVRSSIKLIRLEQLNMGPPKISVGFPKNRVHEVNPRELKLASTPLLAYRYALLFLVQKPPETWTI
jgi:hypothetical protein